MMAPKQVHKDEKAPQESTQGTDENDRLIRVRFSRADGLTHPLRFRRRKKIGDKVYDWKGELFDGKEYKLPRFIVDHLANLSVPIYGEVPIPGTAKETQTKIIGNKQRFNVQILDY